MKKLMLITCLSVLMAFIFMGATTTTIDIPAYKVTSGYTYVDIPFELSDTTNIATVYLYWGISPGPLTLKDSVTSPALIDTFIVLAQQNGTTFGYYITVLDTTGNDSTIIYSPFGGTKSTTDYTQIVGDSGIAHASAYMFWDSTAADSGVAKVVLIVDTANPPTTRQDSSLSSNRKDTTFQVTGLQDSTTYYYYFEASDSGLVDSSAIGTFTTLDLSVALTLELVAGTPTSINVIVEVDSSNDVDGVDSIHIFKGYVMDSLTIVDTLSSITIPDTSLQEGELRGSWVFFWVESWDAGVVDSTATDSIYIPDLPIWRYSDVIIPWRNKALLPISGFVDYSTDGVEKVYYTCWMTGATYIGTDSLKLMIYDRTFGSSVPYDSTALIGGTDTLTIALDSVVCNNKDLIRFAIENKGGALDDIIGNMNMYIEIQERRY